MTRWAVVFDLGAVMVEWAPDKIVANFTREPEQQAVIMREVYCHDDWLELDRGTLTERQMIQRVSQRLSVPLSLVGELFQRTKDSLCVIEKTRLAFCKAKARGLEVYCLSNICEPFFEFLTARYDFFGEFNGAIVSAREKTIKPEKEIFRVLLDRYELQATHCLFVDDRLDNIQAAQQLGFNTVHFSASASCYNKIHRFIEQGL